jgi:hypothetical protein
MAQFLAAMIILLVTYPFIIDLANGDVIENILMVALLISAAFTVNRRDAVAGFILVIPAALCPWLNVFQPGTVPIWVITGTHTVFVGFIIFELLRFVLKATRVNSDVMCAGIAGYLLLGILWTPTYLMVSQLTPGSFTGTHLAQAGILGRFDALYLSFVSLTCLGCNDITPLSKVARMLLMVESLTGVLYLAVMIARLVALYTHSVQEQKDAAKT